MHLFVIFDYLRKADSQSSTHLVHISNSNTSMPPGHLNSKSPLHAQTLFVPSAHALPCVCASLLCSTHMHSLSLQYNHNKLSLTLLLQAPSLPWQIQSFLSLSQSPITIERDFQLLTEGRVLPDKSLPLASFLIFLSLSFYLIVLSNYHYM